MSKIRLDPNDDRPFEDDEQDVQERSGEQEAAEQQPSEETKS